MSKPLSKKSNKILPGIPFEIAVARIQTMLDPNSSVTHNERLVDRIGNIRQFDVVIRGTFAGHNVLGVVECKDHGRKKDPSAIEAFAKKCENIRADLKIMVSRLGFTKQALKLAEHENIRCLSLLPGDEGQTGFSLIVYCYVRIWEWADIRFSLVPEFPYNPQYKADEFLLGGKPLLDLFDKDLEDNYPTYQVLGPVRRKVEFGQQLTICIREQCVGATAVRFSANRVCTYKRKDIQYFGDGVYDWQKGKWTVPDKGKVFSEGWKADFSGWKQIDGPIPSGSLSPFQWVLDVFLPPRTPITLASEYNLRMEADS